MVTKAFPKRKKKYYLKQEKGRMIKGVVFFLNIIAVLGSIMYYLLSYIPPSQQSIFNGHSLFFPLLLVLHLILSCFWLIKLDKRILLSLIILLLGHKEVNCFVAFNSKRANNIEKVNTIKLATFNVLNFKNQNRKRFNVKDNVFGLLDSLEINVLGLQEGSYFKQSVFPQSNFNTSIKSQSWIYSSYKIINFGHLEVLSSTNRKDISYADVFTKKDTVRIYNLHFQSYKFSKDPKVLKKKGFLNNGKKIRKGFRIHEKEVNNLVKHIKRSPYPCIVLGDFNNNAYSYEYNKLIRECNLKDTFVEGGSGFGATFDFSYFPTRIDFILVPKTAKVHSHKVLKLEEWSDHYPVISEIEL